MSYLQEREGFVTAAKELITGDGCTGVPDFWWRRCCDEHDEDYKKKTMSRARADWKFLKCLRRRAKTVFGRWIIAPAYYIGVRVLGRNYWEKQQPLKESPPL